MYFVVGGVLFMQIQAAPSQHHSFFPISTRRCCFNDTSARAILGYIYYSKDAKAESKIKKSLHWPGHCSPCSPTAAYAPWPLLFFHQTDPCSSVQCHADGKCWMLVIWLYKQLRSRCAGTTSKLGEARFVASRGARDDSVIFFVQNLSDFG